MRPSASRCWRASQGYAARFVREEVSNSAVFAPGDVAAAVAGFESLELSERPRPEFVARYARARIAREMADDILALRPAEARAG